jgi:hypothetical protein
MFFGQKMSLGFDLSVTPTFPNASVVVANDDPELKLDDTTGLFLADFNVNAVSLYLVLMMKQ